MASFILRFLKIREGQIWAPFASEGPALSGWGKRVLRFKFISFKSRCRALLNGGTGSVGLEGFFQVSSFTSPVFLIAVGGVVRRRTVGIFGTDRSPSFRGRSWARSVTEGPALSV
ncbi:MAG: hypothetical protein EBS96_10640 [Spartobacteria bacterium]|nr:hypothetical protein [Spartobacteria bacterium]